MPEVPPVPGITGAVSAVFGPDGALARAMPDFEPRAGQLEMAAAVARVFEDGGVLLAEAGTGTGKTLAYLVPAILSRERVLISTGTKNLQEQIYFKDIPALRDALGIPFTATCMKGRANYLCLHKLDQLNDGVGPAVHDVFLPMIREWSTTTEVGDRAELADLPEDLAFWNDVSATADTCIGTECPRYDDCFVTRMRQRAAASDVVIVNHHLLCADAAVRQNAFGEVIPACTRAILDEAHQLEDIATQYFGFNLSTYRVEELARDAEHLPFESHDTKMEVLKAVDRLREHAKTFFAAVAFAHRGDGRVRNEERIRASAESMGETRESAIPLIGAIEVLEATLALIRDVRLKPDTTDEFDTDTSGVRLQPEHGDEFNPGRSVRLQPDHGDEFSPGRSVRLQPDHGEGDDASTLARRAGQLRDDLRFLLRVGDDSYVYFVEFRGRGTFLRAAPIDVSSIISDLLARPDDDDGADVGDADGGRPLRLRPRTARHQARGRNPSAVGVRLPPAGDSVSAETDARSTRRIASPSPPAARSSRSSSARAAAPSCSSPATRRCGRCRGWRKWRSTIRSSGRVRRLVHSC